MPADSTTTGKAPAKTKEKKAAKKAAATAARITQQQFAHLHVHTEYSQLDGASKLPGLVEHAAKLGMSHLAMTDHGNLYGAHAFFQQAAQHGVTPVIGIEAYVAPESRFSTARVRWGTAVQKSDDVSGSGSYTHKTIWAVNATGLHNLIKLSSRAYSEGYFNKWARMDRDLIAEHAKGLVGSTGCPSGEVQTRLRLGQEREALEAAAAWRDIFGAKNYFLELMEHGNSIEKRCRDALLDLGRKLNIKPLVTNDSHYTHAEDAPMHDAMLCINTRSQLSDPDRWRFEGHGYHLRSAAEMYGLDSSDVWQQGCANTMLIAERVDTTGMFPPGDLMPRITPPQGHTETTWLRELAAEGLAQRFPNGIPDGYEDRLAHELGVIEHMGFPSYFLVVADFIGWAKQQGILVGPGRGSVNGCLVAYALRITDVDPMEYGLIFERFLNSERVTMPDIDIDFEDRRRAEVIRYVSDKYGADKVAMIGTSGRIKAKQAVKDAARVLGMPYAAGDRITKAMPPAAQGKDVPLWGILDDTHPRYAEAAEVRAMYEAEPESKQIIDLARSLEGVFRQPGVHAAGILMSAEPITDHVPTVTRPDDGATITQWENETCELLGLLKMDFLGLRNLGIIGDALDLIEQRHGLRIDLETLPLDDPKTYRLLARADSLGVFQLDGSGCRALMRMIKPDTFNDVMAVIALYRPGPMGQNSHINYALRKHGKQPVTAIHEELEPHLHDILDETYGLIVYQEQVIAAAQRLAGYTLGQADLLRRAMGKKKKEVLDKEYVPFREGCRANGLSDHATQVVWDVLVPFADYAFNKCMVGDTVVTRLGSNARGWPQTLRNLANRVHGREDWNGTGCRYCYEDNPIKGRAGSCRKCQQWRAKWKMDGGINAAGRVGDRILPVKITDIFRQGVKPVWKMTLADGSTATSTADHRHLTPAGWRRLDQLQPGHEVCVMGDGEWQSSPRSDYGGSQGWVTDHGYTIEMRSDNRVGPFLHGRWAEYARNRRDLERKCKECGATEGRLEVAHLDGDPLNNKAENLAYLCNSCHKKHDYANGGRTKRWNKGRPIAASPVVSIEYVGEEMTYDVTVDSEDHSWVANGSIVTHNCHTSGYGRIAYWTAYLKANYPAEFMSALLTSVGDNKDRMALYLAECRTMGLTVQPPDVNESIAVFAPTSSTHIRFGLAAVRGVGDNVVADVLATRRAHGRFTSLEDFLDACGTVVCAQKPIDAFIKAGAFDAFGRPRKALDAVHTDLIKAFLPAKRSESHGQDGLFGIVDHAPAPVAQASRVTETEWPKDALLAYEREMLGLYVSDHPLSDIAEALAAHADTRIADLLEESGDDTDDQGLDPADTPDGGIITIAGLVTNLDRKITKKGDAWAAFHIEDLTASIEVLAFPRAWALINNHVADGAVVVAKGRIDRRDGAVRLILNEVRMPQDLDRPTTVTLHVAEEHLSKNTIRQLRGILETHDGDSEVHVRIYQPNGTRTTMRLDNHLVTPGAALYSELKELLGADCLTDPDADC